MKDYIAVRTIIKGIISSDSTTKQDLGRRIDCFKIHLLTLQDIFQESSLLEAAVEDLPPLRDLGNGKWEEFR